MYVAVDMVQHGAGQMLRRACRASLCSNPLTDLDTDQDRYTASWNQFRTALATLRGL